MRHIALLRGINVGGHKPLQMAELRAVCGELGWTDVQTYVQSGNVVFTAPRTAAKDLPARLKGAVADRWGYDVPVVVRSADQLQAVVDDCPFGRIDVAAEGSRVLVAFLAAAPAAARARALGGYVQAPEQLVASGREVYLRCPGGYGKSKLNNNFLEAKLGVTATARNWKTVLKLLEMATGQRPGREEL